MKKTKKDSTDTNMRTIEDILNDLKENDNNKISLERELNKILLSKEMSDERSKTSMVGNTGEWSEIYVFYRIMESGKIKPAKWDENGKLREISDAFLPVLKIMREDEGIPLDYYTANDMNGEKSLKIFYANRNEPLLSCTLSDFTKKANELYDILSTKGEKKKDKGATPGTTKKGDPTWSTFHIPVQKEYLNNLFITKIKSPATKINEVFGGITDITMEILQNDNMRVPVGFSVKSDIGSLPALFNYSEGSNAIYELKNCDADTFKKIKGINKKTSSKYAVDRIQYILHNTNIDVKFLHFLGDTFRNNLRLISDREDEVLAYSLLYSLDTPVDGKGSNRRVTNVIKSLIHYDPLNIGDTSEIYYQKRLKDFLFAKAGGLQIDEDWNGDSLVSGGYIFVTKKGDVLAFYASNQNEYKDWLLKSTKFDTPSSSGGKSEGFAEVYEDENNKGTYLLKLNVLIKFISS